VSQVALTGAGPTGAGGAAFSPTSVTGLAAWFKADAGTSTTTDGVAVSQWNDQSSGAHNLTQATGANQPLYKAAIQNGLPGVLFDGSNDSLDSAGVAVSQPNTTFVAMKAVAVGTNGPNIVNGITTRQVIEVIFGTTNFGFYAGTSDISGGAADTSAHSFSAVFNGVSSQLWKDGTSIATGNPGANNLSGLRLGSFNNTATGGYNGYLFEVLLYSGALSTTDRQSVEGYLRSRWGTP
jgi:hypothetical protein